MRASNLFLPTLKETPKDAELISHQLMLRAGMIRKLASGIYSWLPLGLRVLRKVETIVREEMNRAGAQEILMPSLQPAELWEESDRWEAYGPLLLKIKDRHDRAFCYGPTHEEVVTDLVRDELRSYKQLPCTLYQIQTKFRDEIRPRFGVMRAREFIMKDAYSFALNVEDLVTAYQTMYQAYTNIFTRLELNFRAVLADSGDIGGDTSQEFQVLAESGEDLIAYSDGSDYAANIERAEAVALPTVEETSEKPIRSVDTPNCKSIADVCNYLQCDIKQTLKTLIVKGTTEPYVALVLRGDHEINSVKAENHPRIASPLCFAEDKAIVDLIPGEPGCFGPCDLNIPIIADKTAANMTNFICGAGIANKHLINVNWSRDATYQDIADLRNVQEGDPSPCGNGHLKFARGIEVGHIFQLGDKYSRPMHTCVLDESGQAQPLQMGCYGIGISRIVAAAIEQSHDERGICWPKRMAPFQVVIVPLNMHKSTRVCETAMRLYKQLQAQGVETLLFDQKERPGVLFSLADLIGIPHRLVISDKHLDNQQLEYKSRHAKDAQLMSEAAVFDLLLS